MKNVLSNREGLRSPPATGIPTKSYIFKKGGLEGRVCGWKGSHSKVFEESMTLFVDSVRMEVGVPVHEGQEASALLVRVRGDG